MQQSAFGVILRQIPWIILAAAVGAVVFVVVQKQAGFPVHIGQYIGQQVVQQGGYKESLKEVIGWGVHGGVSLSYAALFGILTAVPFFPRRWGLRWVLSLLLAALLGWLTTLITSPAIAITISVLAGKGWPAQLPPLNMLYGVPFWNHMGFFGICLLCIILVPDLLRGQPQVRQENPADV